MRRVEIVGSDLGITPGATKLALDVLRAIAAVLVRLTEGSVVVGALRALL